MRHLHTEFLKWLLSFKHFNGMFIRVYACVLGYPDVHQLQAGALSSQREHKYYPLELDLGVLCGC